ncbi:unnamed protein product [Phyllotreta striolata]|uniref:CCHC-type domain-containing protein n=1 Tax=Phyllotreta striolata TaxID=444603 RepID=A0A9P0DQW1_PHYSR|nr:unnamed protein product [Phyllotreta striolata]
MLRDRGVGTPEPVEEGSGKAGFRRPSSSDCLELLVGNQAKGSNIATGREKESGGKADNSNVATGFGSPEPVEERSERAGSPRPSASDRNNTKKGKEQPEKEADDSPFFPSRTLMRSPQRKLKDNEESTEMDVTEIKDAGREQTEGKEKTPTVAQRTVPEMTRRFRSVSLTKITPSKKRSREDDTQEFWILLNSVTKTTESLTKMVQNTPNTKVNMREAIKLLQTQMKALNTKAADWEALPPPKKLESTAKTTKSIGIQADVSEHINEMEVEKLETRTQIKKLLEDETDEKSKLLELIDKTWEEEIYTKTSIRNTGLNSIPTGTDIAIAAFMDPKNKNDEAEITKINEKFPGFGKLIDEGLNEGEIEYAVTQTEVTSKKGTEIKKNTTIALPVRMDSSGITDVEAIYNIGLGLREENIIKDKQEIIVTNAGKMDLGYARKILEYLFRKSEKKLIILNTKKKSTQNKPEGQPTTRTKTDAIVVKHQGKTYAELLKEVKANIDIKKTGVKIDKVRKTNNGDLLLEVKDKSTVTKLKTEINDRMKGVQTYHMKDEVVLHVLEIDADMTETDIIEKIRYAHPNMAEKDIRVATLKTMKSGNLAGTIITTRAWADYFDRLGSISFGWSSCTVRRRIHVTRKNKGKQLTEQGVGSPVPVGAGGERAGPHRPSSSDCPGSSVGHQAEESRLATGEEQVMENWLLSRRKIERSPTSGKGRASSCPESTEETGHGESQGKIEGHTIVAIQKGTGKRKRMEETMKDEKGETLKEMREMIERLMKESESLVKLVTTHSNYTKVEIRDKAKDIKRLVDKAGKKVQEIRVEEEESKEQKKKTTTRTIGTQTYLSGDESNEERETLEISETIDRAETFEDLEEIIEKKWPEGVFRAVRETEINKDAYNANNFLLLIGKDNGENTNKFQGLEEIFPGVDEIVRTNNGTTESICSRQSITSRTVQKLIEKNLVIQPLNATGEGSFIKEDLEALQEAIVNLKGKNIVDLRVELTEAINREKARKYLEFISRKAAINAGILTPTYRLAARNKVLLDTVVVKKTEGTYAEMLRTVKTKLDNKDVDLDVRGIQETNNGDLMFKVKAGGGIRLKEIIEKGTQMVARTRGPRGRQKIFHIRGIDEVTAKEEVEMAVKSALGRDVEFTLSSLRPAAKKTQAITLIVDRSAAHRVTDRIKIGVVNCLVEERINIEKCFKCWGIGHKAVDCKEEEKPNRCLRCGGEGHLTRTCKNDPFCVTCNDSGHSTNSMNCPVARKALFDKRQQIRRNSGLMETPEQKRS